jgi:hypothetical protein
MPHATAPGHRLFRAGAIGYLLFAGVHLTAFLSSVLVAPTDPLQIEAERALRAVAVDMGPFHTHFGLLVRLLSASYSTLLLFAGALNLVALPAAVAHGKLRALTLVNLVFCGLLLAIAAAARFPPPMAFALAIEVLFALSWVAQRRGASVGS